MPRPASEEELGSQQLASSKSNEYTRLHITPFDSELLRVVVPARILPEARAISYHTIETFPEKRYGYVELPTAEADKLRKKLNGSVLKGVRMQIEKARPKATIETPAEGDSGKKRKKKSKDDTGEGSKKRKTDHNVVPGVQLEGRKVKRGWTVSDEDKIKEKRSKKLKDKDKDAKEKDKKDKKKKKREQRSKYTDKEECLLKTKLPSSTATVEPEESTDRKKRKKSKSREAVIHEFANTTKFPTFLKSSQPSTTNAGVTEFVEGKGWVDAKGNVVEAVKTRRKVEEKPRKKASPAPAVDSDTSSSSSASSDEDEPAPKAVRSKAEKAPVVQQADDDTTSSSGTSSDEDESDDDEDGEETKMPSAKAVKPATSPLNKIQSQPVDDDTTSSSGTSSEDENTDEEAEGEANNSAAEPEKANASRPNEKANPNLTIEVPPVEVHPLEALYKRQKTGDGATASNDATTPEPFSFFDGGDIEDDLDDAEDGQGEQTGQVPMTPYTQKDFEWRNVRSAAPTPDTAHPSRVKNFWPEAGEDEDDEGRDEMMVDGDSQGGGGEGEAGPGPGGDFQKWFWDNRRELNRSWMQRRKTAAKEKRHRENKSRAARSF
ncbi:hypothetical protein ACRALDRAFT_1060056 [Sodiomyces alcalophilus JCM 7366]|uniref:uncharacterized protein n=1 Tax=Sodiomyces alcalophilus JCM 7366 TaxID=591952 RepID=UPI0039B4D4B5